MSMIGFPDVKTSLREARVLALASGRLLSQADDSATIHRARIHAAQALARLLWLQYQSASPLALDESVNLRALRQCLKDFLELSKVQDPEAFHDLGQLQQHDLLSNL